MDQKIDISEQKVIDEILDDDILTESVKEALIEYSKNTDVHSQLNVTFMEALKSVWSCIRNHPSGTEIKRVLNQEMQDSICKCFTGRLLRLINTLNGFDPRVSVKISDSQEIANVIILVKSKTNNLHEQRRIVTEELVERGYSKDQINEWIGYLE